MFYYIILLINLRNLYMAVFTFSTPNKRPKDEEVVRRVKEHCERKHLNFSGIVIELLKQYEEEVIDGNVR